MSFVARDRLARTRMNVEGVNSFEIEGKTLQCGKESEVKRIEIEVQFLAPLRMQK